MNHNRHTATGQRARVAIAWVCLIGATLTLCARCTWPPQAPATQTITTHITTEQ